MNRPLASEGRLREGEIECDERLYRRDTSRERHGVTTLEMGAMLTLFLTSVLGMLDLGIAVFHYHVVAEAARQGARQAIVHGRLAEVLGPWGPQAFQGTGVDDHPVVDAIRPLFSGLDPGEVCIGVEWPDGGNDSTEGHRVRVTVSVVYRPVLMSVVGGAAYTLEASSTMHMAH